MADSGRWGQMLRGELQSGFARFAGTTVHADLHLPGEWLNRQLVGAVAGGKAGPVTGVSLALLSDNRAVLLIALDRFPLPRRVELPVVVVPQSPDPRSITLELQLEPSGWLRLLLPMFAPLARGQGMQLEGNRLRLRLVDFADDTTVSAIASHLDCLEWSTATGVLRVAGRWTVGSPNPSTDRSDLANADQAASLTGLDHKSAVETDQTQGPRLNLRGTLCLSESLAGDILGEIAAGLPSAGGLPTTSGTSLGIERLELGPVRMDDGKAWIGIAASLRKPG